MNDLLEHKPQRTEQQRLLAVIWNDDLSGNLHGFSVQGINIYRRNLLANAQRALGITFPTVFKLLDSDVSADLVKQFLQASPPDQGDWGQWGDKFADFMATTDISDDYPFLADCSALDWHVHCALHGADQTLDQSSLQILGNCEPEQVVIIFNQNVKLLSSRYPVVDIFDGHHHDDKQRRQVALNNANQALSSALVDHHIMIYRPEFQPRVIKLTSSEGQFTQSLISGNSLAESLDLVSNDAEFSFQHWLLNAIEHNLIHYFKESYS
ncbi:DNA-binding domain-containing protein [Moritella dasanensis]|uniref:HvfC/BufC N-terminal domain-containing protein n=1 Tax=Moritella dasanensis TaxID=428031 RepID=UPI0002FE53D2|nr:DNA-binding domain-containing protein [Moritella dasanensis]